MAVFCFILMSYIKKAKCSFEDPHSTTNCIGKQRGREGEGERMNPSIVWVKLSFKMLQLNSSITTLQPVVVRSEP